MILQPILLRKPVRTDLPSVIEGKLQLKQASAAKKVTLTRIKQRGTWETVVSDVAG